jgi:hypothetical protein
MGRVYEPEALARRIYWIVTIGVGIEVAVMLLIAF